MGLQWKVTEIQECHGVPVNLYSSAINFKCTHRNIGVCLPICRGFFFCKNGIMVLLFTNIFDL